MINRRDFLKIAGSSAAVAASGCTGLVGNGGGGNPGQPPPGASGDISAVQHIIFTMQENRSFDHYFGKLPQYRAANGYPGEVAGLPAVATNPSYDKTYLVESHHIETDRHENLSPAWNESHRQWNRQDPSSSIGTLDGFVYAAANYSRQVTSEPTCDYEGVRAMGYYDETDLPYYYALGSKFAISDQFFSSVLSATQPNRMYLLSGSSHGYVRPLRESAGDRQIAAPTIFDVLEEKGVSWKIYLVGKGTPNAYSYYALFQGYNSHFDKVVDGEQFFADLSNGALPQVVMFESGVNTGLDEHPRNNIQEGVKLMKRLFTAVMNSSIWSKSVTFLNYDEGGGFYDHVPPPNAPKPDDKAPILLDTDTVADFDRYGFRVPFVAVSPFAKKSYVSHSVADHTSILKFIETRFGLASLTARDAAAHNLLDMFDFANAPWLSPPDLSGITIPNNGQNICNV